VEALRREEDECLAGADVIIAASRVVRDALRARGRRVRVEYVPPGVDVDRFDWESPEPAARPLVLYVGNLRADRGVAGLVEAAAEVLRFRDARFVIAGRGGTERVEGLRQLARACGVSESVQVCGDVPHEVVPDLLAQANVVVAPYSGAAPSVGQGAAPYKILEALACRRAVVAARIPRVEEVVADGIDGLLVPPDDVDELAGAIETLLADPTLAARLAEAGYRKVRDGFTASAARRRMNDVYRRLFGGRVVRWTGEEAPDPVSLLITQTGLHPAGGSGPVSGTSGEGEGQTGELIDAAPTGVHAQFIVAAAARAAEEVRAGGTDLRRAAVSDTADTSDASDSTDSSDGSDGAEGAEPTGVRPSRPVPAGAAAAGVALGEGKDDGDGDADADGDDDDGEAAEAGADDETALDRARTPAEGMPRLDEALDRSKTPAEGMEPLDEPAPMKREDTLPQIVLPEYREAAARAASGKPAGAAEAAEGGTGPGARAVADAAGDGAPAGAAPPTVTRESPLQLVAEGTPPDGAAAGPGGGPLTPTTPVSVPAAASLPTVPAPSSATASPPGQGTGDPLRLPSLPPGVDPWGVQMSSKRTLFGQVPPPAGGPAAPPFIRPPSNVGPLPAPVAPAASPVAPPLPSPPPPPPGSGPTPFIRPPSNVGPLPAPATPGAAAPPHPPAAVTGASPPAAGPTAAATGAGPTVARVPAAGPTPSAPAGQPAGAPAETATGPGPVSATAPPAPGVATGAPPAKEPSGKVPLPDASRDGAGGGAAGGA